MDEQGISRAVVGELKVLQKVSDKLYRVEIWALNSLVNRNNWKYVNLREHLDEFRNIPILTAYLPFDRIGDGHNFDIKRDPRTGEEYASFTAADAERIVGWVDQADEVRIEDKDGTEWVVVTGSLWAFYARELVEKIAVQGRMSVSIETLVTRERREENYDVEEEYVVLGITILGDGVEPAVVDAEITPLRSRNNLSVLRDGMKQEIMKAASYNAPEEPKKTDKGVKNLNELSKRQIADLRKHFDGYTVLAAGQDESGIHVCLLCADGATAIYNMETAEETFAPERVTKVNAKVLFDFGGDESNCVVVDACEMTDSLNARCDELEAALNKANADLETANSTIQAMELAESKRRVSAAKEKAKSVLAAFNANREDVVSESILGSVEHDIDAGLYTNMVNAEGVWTGDEAVKEKVLAQCAASVMEMDRKASEKNRNTQIWNKIGGGVSDDGTVGGLLAKKGIR